MEKLENIKKILPVNVIVMKFALLMLAFRNLLTTACV